LLTQKLKIPQNYGSEKMKSLKYKIMKWSPFLNRDKSVMCREQVIQYIEDWENDLKIQIHKSICRFYDEKISTPIEARDILRQELGVEFV
jgi:hypothetical protein